MKTIQEVIREFDYKEIEKAYFKEHPIQIRDFDEDNNIDAYVKKYYSRFNSFLDIIKNKEGKVGSHGAYVLLYTKSYEEWYVSPSVILVSLDEIKNTENMSDIESYAYEFTRWEEAVTFLVADNKLTQDNLMDVVVDFLYEVSFNGYTEEAVDKAIAELHESTAELENSGIEADEVFMHELIDAVPIEEYPDEDALKDDTYRSWRLILFVTMMLISTKISRIF